MDDNGGLHSFLHMHACLNLDNSQLPAWLQPTYDAGEKESEILQFPPLHVGAHPAVVPAVETAWQGHEVNSLSKQCARVSHQFASIALQEHGSDLLVLFSVHPTDTGLLSRCRH